ncbi:GRB10-interacting GYF protein 2-like isoform X2 [Gigantopelta aegis]|uniref:GRB10-interacting GYF protein 2-like isoform X2 n=1 Tax=Gigantopelta aegis TaxID=1735272 RepID=UPI001B88E1AF|nr:GRB10-interacting GYF protein 2-like isoform X2 [Gigantopelta aegis]
MADTLKFGPEWLRALSDGNTVASPPPTPSLGKFKLAEYRYGREEMLALFQEKYETPADLLTCPSVCSEETQKPLALIPLSEEEQRLMSQSVNSMTVLRGMGRGGPPMRGRGISDRGRGRGRGRGEGFMSRGVSLENGETGGGFGRPPPRTNKDGWEEVGKKFDRGFTSRSQDDGIPPVRREYTRSLSNDNWREKDEDDDGDWRRVGVKDRWGAKGSWRDPNYRAGFDQDRKINDVPEWSVTGDEDMDGLGTFDASGQFVTTDLKDDNKEKNDREEKPVLPPEKDSVNISRKVDKLPSKEEKSTKDKDSHADEKSVTKDSAPKEQRKESAKKTKPKENGSSEIGDKTPMSPPEVKKTEKKKLKTEKQTAPTHKKQSAESSKSDSPVVNKKHTADRSPSKAGKETKSLSSKPVEKEVLDRLEKEAENLVANVTSEESGNEDSPVKKEETAPVSVELAVQWFYRDPQGDTQGPFTPDEMAQWFSAGYFTMNLLVKRGCDERFQQLGELIKRWGRVPFLGGPSPPPLLNNPVSTAGNESAVKAPSPQPVPIQPTPLQPGPPLSNQLEMLQQQFLMQQLLQQQLVMRQMTMQMMTEMQEQESFKALPPAQQQQLATQMLMQTQPLLFQQLQQMQQQQKTDRLSPQPATSEAANDTSPPTFHRSTSQPVTTANIQDPPNISGSWSQPTSVWDLEQPKTSISPNGLRSQMETQRSLQEDEDQRRKLDEFQRAQDEIRRQQEELERQREQVMREKEELERQKQMELKRLEEARQDEIRKRREQQERERQEKEASERILQVEMENRRREEEERQRREQEERQRREQEDRQRREQEDRQRREQEERQRQEIEKRKRLEAERHIQEAKRQMEEAEERERREEMLRQQEAQRQQDEFLRQQELQKQAAEEEKQRQMERQRQQIQQEMQRQQEQQRQQQEALYKLQQQQREQLAHMQLPPSAKWAENDNRGKSKSSLSLAEIQEQEERERQEKQRVQMELQQQQQQQQQIMFQQQQQQQQQKSWANHMQTVNVGDGLKTLLEIQAEQEMQLEHDRKKRKPHQQQQQPRQMATVKQDTEDTAFGTWNAPPAPAQSGWGDNSIWSSDKSTALGFWDDAIISTSKKAPTKNKDQGEFPALGNKKQVQNQKSANRSKPKSNIKEKEVVQRLFQSSRPTDDFTLWCEKALSSMASSVDVPTFIAFLQDVESPYEVHDYVKSYLGESKQTSDFARQFLEKRSHYKNKARLEKQQEEDSIWGPAPAVNPKETRSALTDVEKAKGKKKKRMQKIDQSILGFTVHASQNRVNAGEIDPAD